MKHLDLFSGIGGFALAARWAGIETVAFCEIDPFCRQVLRKHWPDVLKYMDIRHVTNPDHVDIMTAGFPCQPFSIAGSKKGKDDDRYLWPEVIRLIRKSKPNWFIGENVPGIIPMLDPIIKDLEDEGYQWQAFLIPASAIGAPHKRERLWIVANRDRKRCHNGIDNRQERPFHIDWQRHIETIQSEWTQFIPKSWATFNAQEWLGITANANGIKCHQGAKNQEAITKRLERSQPARETGHDSCTNQSTFNWQEDEPPIPGVDDGLPNGLDRNKALGNAIVPQIPYVFMSIIKQLESQKVLKSS